MSPATSTPALLAYFDADLSAPSAIPHSAFLADLFDTPTATSFPCPSLPLFESAPPAVSPAPPPVTPPAPVTATTPYAPAAPFISDDIANAFHLALSPVLSSSSALPPTPPSFNPHPYESAAAPTTCPAPVPFDWSLPPPPLGRTGLGAAANSTSEACFSDVSDSDHGELDVGGASFSVPSRQQRRNSKSKSRPRTSLPHATLSTGGVKQARARAPVKVDLKVGMVYEGKVVTKVELRRIKNRESSARSYYNRRARVEALEADLTKSKELAGVLLRKELSLRKENARLKKQSFTAFGAGTLAF